MKRKCLDFDLNLDIYIYMYMYTYMTPFLYVSKVSRQKWQKQQQRQDDSSNMLRHWQQHSSRFRQNPRRIHVYIETCNTAIVKIMLYISPTKARRE